jgi:hypothetical protein
MSATLSSTTASALAPFLTDATGIASLGSTAYGLYNQYQNQQYQNLLRSYAQNPAKMNAYAAQFTQPLNAGLTAAVNNQTQAQLAQAGLSESPQISQAVESQAIAPYIQQNQQQGYQDALQALNLGGGAIPPALQQTQGIAGLAKAFSQLGGGSLAQLMQLAARGNNQAGSIPLPSDNLPDQIPYDPTQTIDLSSFYSPDYGGGDSDADSE